MKRTLIALSLCILCTQQTTFSMEMEFADLFDNMWQQAGFELIDQKKQPLPQQPTTQTLPLDELISLIDAEINEKYSSDFFKVFSDNLTDENFLNVMYIIDKHSHPTSLDLLNKLYKKNTGCRYAIERFLLLARKNIEKVTFDTLGTIQNPALSQSITLLDDLPAPIKKLIMESAYNKTTYDYEIVLKGHTDRIQFFDICTATHHAATSSFDTTLRLWDLQTGQCVHTFSEKNADTIFCIAFNTDGSLLATMQKSKIVDHTIKIWSTAKKSKQLLHVIYNNNTEIRVKPSDENDIKMLIGVIRTYAKYDQNNYDDRFSRTYWNNKYKTCLPRYNRDSILRVKKPDCRPLHLCKQIVKNTPNISAEKLNQLPLFGQLNEYEKNIATNALITKQERINLQLALQ